MPRLGSGKVIGYLLLLLVIDVCLAPALGAGVLHPMFLYLMIPYAAFEWHWNSTLATALFIGVFLDLAGSHPLGVQTSVLGAASFALDFAVLKIQRDSLVMRMVTVFIFTGGVLFSSLVLSAFLGTPEKMTGIMILQGLGTAFATAALTPVFFFLTSRLFRDRRIASKQYELFG